MAPDNKHYISVFSTKNDTTKNEGFTDIWTWDKTAEGTRVDIEKRSASCKLYKALNKCLSGYDMLLSNAVTGNKGAMRAYLTFMGPRLVEMHRVLTETGSMYMHCDPNISHYLKVLMDAIWNHSNGQESFKNEIVWYYRRFSGASRKYRKMHDIILFYTKTENYVFTTPKPVYEDKLFRRDKEKDIIDKKPDRMQDDKEKYKRIRTRTDDAFLRDVWDDIGILSLMVAERLGYPTQKPSLLYTRMIETSSKDGDVVLDPFCGCGTTLDAAQALKRKWIGIDSSIIALDVTEQRLKDKYSLKLSEDYEIVGFPTNFKGVRDLASKETNHTILANWAATRLNLIPSKDADNDTETTLWSLRDKKREDVRIAAEVKVGKPSPDQVRQLQKFIENNTADIVILITLEPVTSEMREIADRIEKFKYKGLSFPRLQFWQITDKFFDDPESVYDVLQLPGKLRVKPTKKDDRPFAQKMAQEALPILVSHAQKGNIIIMRDLAKDIAPELIQFNFTMRHVLAWIRTTLWELERSEDWNYGEIPGITAIVLDSPKTPTKWMDRKTRVDPNTPLPWKDYETEHLLPVFKYPHWNKVMDFVFGS